MWKWLPANFTLPTIYDETLSYELQLKRLMKKFAELCKYVDEIGSRMDKLEQKIINEVNQMLIEFKKELDDEWTKLAQDIIKRIEKNEQEINNQWVVIGDKFKEMDDKYEDLVLLVRKLITESEARTRDYADRKVQIEKTERVDDINALWEFVRNLQNTKVGYVYNPCRDKVTEVPVFAKDMWITGRPFALVSKALADTGATWGDMSNKNISFYEMACYNSWWKEMPVNPDWNINSGDVIIKPNTVDIIIDSDPSKRPIVDIQLTDKYFRKQTYKKEDVSFDVRGSNNSKLTFVWKGTTKWMVQPSDWLTTSDWVNVTVNVTINEAHGTFHVNLKNYNY